MKMTLVVMMMLLFSVNFTSLLTVVTGREKSLHKEVKGNKDNNGDSDSNISHRFIIALSYRFDTVEQCSKREFETSLKLLGNVDSNSHEIAFLYNKVS